MTRIVWLLVGAGIGLAAPRAHGETAEKTPAASAVAPAPDVAPRTLDELFHALGKVMGISARFHEKKKITLLTRPLESTGAIYFVRPGNLARHVEKPVRSVVYLDEKRIVTVDGSSRRVLDLHANALVAAMAESFVHVLRGDRAALEKEFMARFEATDTGWTLLLAPRRAALTRAIRELRFEGVGLEVRGMKLLEATGDETVTTFTNVDTKRRFTDEERTRLLLAPSG